MLRNSKTFVYMCFLKYIEHVEVKFNQVIQIGDQCGIGLLHIDNKNVKYFCPIKKVRLAWETVPGHPRSSGCLTPFFIYILELLSIFFLDTFIYEDSWKTQKPSTRILPKRILFNIWILWTPSEAHGPMLVLEQTLPRHCVWVTPQWTL